MRKKVSASPGGERRERGVLTEIRGDRVRALRKARGWTQPELGFYANLNEAEVSRIERGKKGLRDPALKRLAMALNTSSDYLIDLTDNSKAAK